MRGYFLESNLSIETQSCVLKEIVTFTQAFLPLLFQVGFCSSTRDKHWQSELSFFVPGGQLRKSRKCHVVSFTATPHTHVKNTRQFLQPLSFFPELSSNYIALLLPFETLEKLVSTPSVINKNERKKISTTLITIICSLVLWLMTLDTHFFMRLARLHPRLVWQGFLSSKSLFPSW